MTTGKLTIWDEYENAYSAENYVLTFGFFGKPIAITGWYFENDLNVFLAWL